YFFSETAIILKRKHTYYKFKIPKYSIIKSKIELKKKINREKY
ncbi:hypothetical protein V322_00233, partial [Staphylococcus aureus F19466]